MLHKNSCNGKVPGIIKIFIIQRRLKLINVINIGSDNVDVFDQRAPKLVYKLGSLRGGVMQASAPLPKGAGGVPGEPIGGFNQTCQQGIRVTQYIYLCNLYVILCPTARQFSAL